MEIANFIFETITSTAVFSADTIVSLLYLFLISICLHLDRPLVDMDIQALAYYIGLAVINFMVTILNSLLVFMFYARQNRLLNDNLNNQILLSMSVANLLVGVTGFVNWTVLAVGNNPLIYYKLFGMIPMFASMFASTIILCILTLNQLIAVLHPLRYNSLMTARRVRLSIFFAFLFAGIFAINEWIVYNLTSSSTELRVRTVFMTVVFIIGAFLLAVSNYKLYRAIQYQRRRLVPLSAIYRTASENQTSTVDLKHVVILRNSAHTLKQKMHLKRGTTCIFLVFIFIFTWLPITCYYFSAFCGRDTSIVPLRRICITIATCNSIFNPCLYLLQKKNFRVCLMEIFRWRTSENSIGN